MRIGDEEITRDQLPAMQAWQMNPDHLSQGIQDILDQALNKGLTNPASGEQVAMQQGTLENRNNVWEPK